MFSRSSLGWTLVPLFILLLVFSTTTVLCQTIACLAHCNSTCTCTQNKTYQCADGTCIALNKYRNGIIDCKDQSDEDINCCPEFFKCDTMANGIGKCLPINFIDDGVVQCVDGSDETSTNDKTCSILTAQAFQNSKTVNDYVYKCQMDKYGTKSPKCVKLTWCMDGKFDCPLGDDEDPARFDRCKSANPCGANADCVSHGNVSYTCTCKTGFTGDPKSGCTSAG